MERIASPAGPVISYEKYGFGPPLVLVHGGFSDHQTNWEFVRPLFAKLCTVYAIARRGRGETDATADHSVEDEALDLLALITAIQEPVFLLGHSYGAHVALAAAAKIADRIRKLVLYEAAWPGIIGEATRLDDLAQIGDWDGLATTFTELWPPIISDAQASLHDLRALSRYDFKAERFRELRVPVMLQIGSESPRHLYVTDALATVLPDVRIESLTGQAHEAMTTAPELYAESVFRFLAE